MSFSKIERTPTSKRFASSTSLFDIDSFGENSPSEKTTNSTHNQESSEKSSEKDLIKQVEY